MDELDKILLSEQPPPPSAGFTDSVMRAVRECGARMGAIGFPWRRYVPGLIGSLSCVLVGAAVVFPNDMAGHGIQWAYSWGLSPMPSWAAGLMWAAMALIGSVLVVRLCVEFTSA